MSLAYQPTSEDVENVLRANSLAVANSNGKSFEAMAEELFDNLNFFLIEKSALRGNELDQQTAYANEEIARQLRESGVLDPLKESHADLKARGYSVHPSATQPGYFQWSLQMVRNNQKFPAINRPENFASEAIAWADALQFQQASNVSKNPDIVTLRLTLDVTYDLKGESITAPRVLLCDLVKHALANGMLSGNTKIEVNDFATEITQISAIPGDGMSDDAGDAAIERNRG